MDISRRRRRAYRRDAAPAQPPRDRRAHKDRHGGARHSAPAHRHGAFKLRRDGLRPDIRRGRWKRPLRQSVRRAVHGRVFKWGLRREGRDRRARPAGVHAELSGGADTQPRRAGGRVSARRIHGRRGVFGPLSGKAACILQAPAPLDTRRLAEHSFHIRARTERHRQVAADRQPAPQSYRPGDAGGHHGGILSARKRAARGGVGGAACPAGKAFSVAGGGRHVPPRQREDTALHAHTVRRGRRDSADLHTAVAAAI